MEYDRPDVLAHLPADEQRTLTGRRKFAIAGPRPVQLDVIGPPTLHRGTQLVLLDMRYLDTPLPKVFSPASLILGSEADITAIGKLHTTCIRTHRLRQEKEKPQAN